jgi:serine/threonine-protein kinase
MLTGRLPFDADTPWAWATQHMTAQPFPFETVPMGGAIPPKMKAAVMRALSKEKERRQQTAREFFEELTLGTTRSSRTSHAEASAGGPSGTAFMPQASSGQRAGTGTQMGEPIFSQGAPMVDGHPSAPPGYPSDPSLGGGGVGGQPSVPTGSGQAYPAPPPPAAKGGSGAIIAIVGVVAVLAIGTGVFFATRGGGKENGSTTPSATATVAHTAAPKAEPGCEQVIEIAKTNAIGAVEAMAKCPKAATNHEAAIKAINTKAVTDAEKQGCAAMEEARRAASIDAVGAYNLLQQKRCK